MIGRCLKFLYYICITCAFCANMLVVAQTTALSVLGASMALRGPDGSMMTATDGLYEERMSVFTVFAFGLACTLGSVVLIVWIILHWEAALVCMFITVMTCRQVYLNYHRVRKRFDFDESETVDFRDIFDSAANIHTYRHATSNNNSNNNNNRQSQYNHKKSPGRTSKSKRKNSYSHHHHRQGSGSDNYHDREDYPDDYNSDNEGRELIMRPNSYGGRSSGNVQRRMGAASGNSSEGSRNGDSSSPEYYIQTV
jgi:hypothetical protein